MCAIHCRLTFVDGQQMILKERASTFSCVPKCMLGVNNFQFKIMYMRPAYAKLFGQLPAPGHSLVTGISKHHRKVVA